MSIKDYGTVSVAIAAIEKPEKLLDLVASVIPQVGTTDEIIIVVEAPATGAPSNMVKEVAYEIAKQVPLVKVLESQKRGYKACFELAISASTRDTIFLAEPGDIWAPDKVAVVLGAFLSQDFTLCLHDAKLNAPKLNNKYYPSMFEFFGAQGGLSKRKIRDALVGSCMAIRQPLCSLILPFPEGVAQHDQWIGLVAEKYGGVILVREALSAKSVGDGSDDLSLLTDMGVRHREQRKLLKILKKRKKEIVKILHERHPQ